MRFALGAIAAIVLFAAPAQASLLITVNKSTQRMTVAVDGETLYTWPVSTGARGYDTPSGEFKPFRMEKDHFSREWDDAPMPNSIFFTMKGHAIHGSSHRKALGTPASHGCVRLSVEHSAILWKLVKREKMANTRVVLTGEIPPPPAPPLVARGKQKPKAPAVATAAPEAPVPAEAAPAPVAAAPAEPAAPDSFSRVFAAPPRTDVLPAAPAPADVDTTASVPRPPRSRVESAGLPPVAGVPPVASLPDDQVPDAIRPPADIPDAAPAQPQRRVQPPQPRRSYGERPYDQGREFIDERGRRYIVVQPRDGRHPYAIVRPQREAERGLFRFGRDPNEGRVIYGYDYYERMRRESQPDPRAGR